MAYRPIYRRIFVRFWRDEAVRRLNEKEKLVALYALTSAQTNRCGLFVFSVAMAEEELGLHGVRHGVLHPLTVVCETLNWVYEEGSRVLWIPSWWRYNPPANRSAMTGYLKDLDELPQTPLLKRFMENTADIPPEMRGSFVVPLDTVCHTVSDTCLTRDSGTGTGTGVLNTYVDLPKKKLQIPSAVIDEIYARYPRKVNPRSAKVEIRRAVDRSVRMDAAAWLLAKTIEYAESPRGAKPQKGQTDYRPHPARWFKAGGYDSDPAEWQQHSERRDVSENGSVSLFSDEALKVAVERGMHDDVKRIKQGMAEIEKSRRQTQ